LRKVPADERERGELRFKTTALAVSLVVNKLLRSAYLLGAVHCKAVVPTIHITAATGTHQQYRFTITDHQKYNVGITGMRTQRTLMLIQSYSIDGPLTMIPISRLPRRCTYQLSCDQYLYRYVSGGNYSDGSSNKLIIVKEKTWLEATIN